MKQAKLKYKDKNHYNKVSQFKFGLIKASKVIQYAFACIGYTLLYLLLGSFGGKLENKKI